MAEVFGAARYPISVDLDGVAWEMDTFTLPSAMIHCQQARQRVDRLAETLGFSKAARRDVMMAVGEAVTNAIEHGNAGEDDHFTVRCLATPERLCISVSDNGSGFCPDSLPSMQDALFQEHGRGIHCIRALMDEVTFFFDAGTTVRMVKER
jgi:serine/threonine-protein kinase RsbW